MTLLYKWVAVGTAHAPTPTCSRAVPTRSHTRPRCGLWTQPTLLLPSSRRPLGSEQPLTLVFGGGQDVLGYVAGHASQGQHQLSHASNLGHTLCRP